MTGNSGSGAVRAGNRRAWAWELLFRLQKINKYRMRYVGLGRDNLRSHFVFRPRHAPEWLRAPFLPGRLSRKRLEEELTGKTFTTSLDTTNPNTYVKFIFLRTSPLRDMQRKRNFTVDLKKYRARRKKREALNTHSIMFIFHEKCQTLGHVKMQNLPWNTHYRIFGVLASPWTTQVKDWKKKIGVFMGNEKCLWTPLKLARDTLIQDP